MIEGERRQAIEAVVNSKEAEELFAEKFDENWDTFRSWLPSLTAEEEGNLERDLYDWWKNGNFHVWEEGEKNEFGMTRWELGDPDFWEELA